MVAQVKTQANASGQIINLFSMQQNIETAILESKRIPNLPSQTQRLLRLLKRNDLNLKELADFLEKNQVITTRLLAVANSAWYAPAKPIVTVEAACMYLGMTLVRSICIGLAVIAPFNLTACPGFSVKRFWLSSMAVCEASTLLSQKHEDQELAQVIHTAGLLHNIGLLCLADLLPKQTHSLLQQAKTNPQKSLTTLMQEQWRTDYGVAGGLLARKWGLPEELTVMIANGNNKVLTKPPGLAYLALGKYMASTLNNAEEVQPPENLLLLTGLPLADYQSMRQKLEKECAKYKSLADSLFR